MTNDKYITRRSGANFRDNAVRDEVQSDLSRIDALTPDEIESAAAQQLEEDGLHAGWVTSVKVVPSRNKRALSLRLDAEVFDWFYATGPGYQSRINDVLRAYVQFEKAQRKDMHAAP